METYYVLKLQAAYSKGEELFWTGSDSEGAHLCKLEDLPDVYKFPDWATAEQAELENDLTNFFIIEIPSDRVQRNDRVKVIDVFGSDAGQHMGKVAIAIEPYAHGWKVRLPENDTTKWFLAVVEKIPPKTTHIIKVSDAHLKAIAKACEFYTRIQLGQLERVADALEHHLGPEDFQDFQKHMEELKPIVTGLAKNASFGISGDKVHLNGKLAYEVWRTIERHDQIKRGIPGSDPLELSGEDMPKIIN